MQVTDNFLDKKVFKNIQKQLLGSQIAWFYNPTIDYTTDKNEYFQFCHTFYRYNQPQSNSIELLQPLLDKLSAYSLLRVKANLLTKTSTIIKNGFHVDESELDKKKLEDWTTSIFYINHNDGFTEFADGTKVESVANRMLTFPANLMHRGTSCTNTKSRVVINFMYYHG